MALVGVPNDRGTTLILLGDDGVNDDDVILELDDVQRFNEFYMVTTLGIFDVEVSYDGTNFYVATMTDQSIVAAVEVLVSIAAHVMKLTLSSIKSIRVSQNGATDATDPRLMCGQVGRTR